jgi:hypothetical protein
MCALPRAATVHGAGLADACRRGDWHRRVSSDAFTRRTVSHDAASRIVYAREGWFFNDGRFPTLRAVVDHSDQHFRLGLSETDKMNLIEYLKSL